MIIKTATPERELKKIKNFKNEILKLLDSGNYIGGNNVKSFENSISKILNIKYVSSLNSGTDALLLSLIALGIKKNDEVIIPSFTYFATAETVMQLGAKPVFADLENNSFTVSARTIEKVITKKTKCIIPVHLFGCNADIENIYKLSQYKKIKIIEDTAQAFGSKSVHGKYLGTFGNVNAFSNYPSKTLGGIGDGGFITTNNLDIYKKIQLLKNHGQSKQYTHVIPGFNSRLDELNAYVLNSKLNFFNEISKSRKIFANFYFELLNGYSEIFIPEYNKNILLNNFSLLVDEKVRNKLLLELNKKNINARIYYETPLHLQKAIKSNYKINTNKLKNTEYIAKRIITLPFFAFPKKSELEYLELEIKNCLRSLGIK